MRSKIWSIIFMGLLALSVLVVAEVPLAQAQNASLRGDYNFTFTRTCEASDGAGTPLGVPTFAIVMAGNLTYDGLGAGSFSGQGFLVAPGALNGTDQTCSVSYTVNSDGSVLHQFSCNLTFTSGSLNTQTATLTGNEVLGQLSLDGTVIVLSNTAPNIETFTLGANPPNSRVCAGSGLATSQR